MSFRGCKPVELRSLIVEVAVGAGLKFGKRSGLGEFHAAPTDGGSHTLGRGSGVDEQGGALVGHKSVEAALGGENGYGEVALGSEVHGHGGGCRLAATVGLGGAVVVVFGHFREAGSGIEFVDAVASVDAAHIVVGIDHGYDRALPHEYRELPHRGWIVVDHASALVGVAIEIVDPHTLGQIDAIAYIVALSIGGSGLIDRSHEEVGAVEER